MQSNLTINIISIISLSYTISFSAKNIELNIEPKSNKINNLLMILTIFMLCLNICTFLLPITSNYLLISIHYLINLLIDILIPLFPTLGIIFLKSALNLKCNFKKLFSPNIINIFICLLNLKFNFLYSINENNIYSRSSYFLLPILFSLLYILYFLILIHRNRFNLFKPQLLYFLLCMLTLIISLSIQLLFENICIFWPTLSAILIINYIVIQQKALYYNTITLCKNKFALTKTLYYLFLKKTLFSLVFIKIENLNYVSNTFGSKEEKKAIIRTYKSSKNFFLDIGEVFHYKNDCFVALIEYSPKISINKIMTDLDNFFFNLNKYSPTSYTLKYKFNYDLFDNNYSNIIDYLYYINNLIYNLPSYDTKN